MLTEEQIRLMTDEQYMNSAQLEFFRHRLIQMKIELQERQEFSRKNLSERENLADVVDRAAAEDQRFLDWRLREREANLMAGIDRALRLIRSKDYGFCEDSGMPIGIDRLLARPTATVGVDSKQMQEHRRGAFRKSA